MNDTANALMEMEETFGLGCNLLKVGDAIIETINEEEYYIDGETGETLNPWDDGYFEMEGVPV